MELHSGVLNSFWETSYYNEEIDLDMNLFHVKIDTVSYYVGRRKERKIIEPYEYELGDSIKGWTNLNDVYIKQLIVNNQMVMVYKPPYWMAWFFTIAGVVFTVMSVFYLIKYNEDYFGKG